MRQTHLSVTMKRYGILSTVLKKLKYSTLHLTIEQQNLTVVVTDKVILIQWGALLYYQE